MSQIAQDAVDLDCVPEVERTREIVAAGNSADHQLRILEESQEHGAFIRDTIVPVVDWIARVTEGR